MSEKAKEPSIASPAKAPAKFTSGSTMRHVITMTATSSIGLIAVFFVDALNLFYISLLGEAELAAAIGYAGTLSFFFMSVSIGLTIATGALVSRSLGKGDREEAALTGGGALLIAFLTLGAMSALTYPFLTPLLSGLGAAGSTLDLAKHFLIIVLPSIPLLAIGMGASGILRGVGDAKRAMYVTLIGAAVTMVVDPILIFVLDLGITGAAITTVISRFVILAVGLYGAVRIHNLVQLPHGKAIMRVAMPFFAIALPAVATQLATPVGNAYVTAKIAEFGDEAVAAWAIIGRLIPVAFGAIFALSGAVGPILGQNYGAGLYSRIRQTMRDALLFTLLYVVTVWALLAFFAGNIASIFGLEGEAYGIVVFFCTIVAGSFLFNGTLFVANAAFNNLGYATYSTVFNWGRATLGTFPFVYFGAQYYGALGVLGGWGLGAIVFGIASVIVCFRVIGTIETQKPAPKMSDLPPAPSASQAPFSSSKASV